MERIFLLSWKRKKKKIPPCIGLIRCMQKIARVDKKNLSFPLTMFYSAFIFTLIYRCFPLWMLGWCHVFSWSFFILWIFLVAALLWFSPGICDGTGSWNKNFLRRKHETLTHSLALLRNGILENKFYICSFLNRRTKAAKIICCMQHWVHCHLLKWILLCCSCLKQHVTFLPHPEQAIVSDLVDWLMKAWLRQSMRSFDRTSDSAPFSCITAYLRANTVDSSCLFCTRHKVTHKPPLKAKLFLLFYSRKNKNFKGFSLRVFIL